MADALSQKTYLLGSKFNGNETVILKDKSAMRLWVFANLEDAKDSFSKAYKLLLSPSFTPSSNPGKEEIAYHQGFMRLMTFYPVILELEKENYLQIFRKWRKKKAPIFKTKEKFYNREYWYCPMRTGFFKEYAVLDIVQDIESTPFVGPDGQMVLRINQISQSTSNDTDNNIAKQISEEEVKKILRKRGYL